MNKVYLKVPSKEELHYRQAWMNDPKTMNYNAGFDIDLKGYNKTTGTISKTDEEMIEWHNKWINKEPDKYFAYIYDEGIEEPVGEIYYYLDNGIHSMGILVADKFRGKGYSYPALMELEKVAFEKNNINELSDMIPLHRVGAIKTFKKAGFIHTDKELIEKPFGKETIARQLLITKDMYFNNKYNDIVDKMKQEIIKRSNDFEKQTKGTKDEYNLYKEHVQYVYNYVIKLSEGKNVDVEVLKISVLLHDIAMTDKNLDRSKHNEYGAEIAKKLLKENNYPEDKINLVTKCILNHSSKRAEYRTTLEERILVDADGLSHFDSINNLYLLAHKSMGLNDKDALKFIQEKLTRDFNEISDDLKHLIDKKYNKVMNAQTIEELF